VAALFEQVKRDEGRLDILVNNAFALRTNVVEWSGMVPTMEIPFADVAGIELNGVAARSREDISYRRPLIKRRERHYPE
jgi:NAD(P)-dependent dehydrogenase (short-subunit alcohol dehydrogenase family)